MKAVAQLHKNGKDESIVVDGEVFIKSCRAGQWNYIVKVVADLHGGPRTVIGKSGSLKAAQSWVPHQMSYDYYPDCHTAEEMDAAKKAPGAKVVKLRSGRRIVRVPISFTREVFPIEREGV